MAKSSGTLYWNSSRGTPLAETNSSGTLNKYIFLGAARIARRDSSGNVYYYFQDQVGTTKTLTNSSGVVCYDADFLPFGYEMAYTTSCAQNYKFTGLERDSETSLDQTLYRKYDSTLGRWLSPDPAGQDAADPSDPQTWNMYAYVRDNPSTLTDPTGERYSVCQADENGSQTNCVDISDEQFEQFQQENKDTLTFTGNGDVLQSGTVIGSYEQTSVDLSPFASDVIADVSAKRLGDFIFGFAGTSVVAGTGVGMGLYATGAGASLTTLGLQTAPAIAPLLPAVPSAIVKLQQVAQSLRR